MKYQVKLGNNNEIPLPDELCKELNIHVGDILLCKKVASLSELVLTKHISQTLSDAEIISAGNLARVVSCIPS